MGKKSPKYICRIVLSGERGLYEVGCLEEGVWHCDSVDSFDSESDALGRACMLNGSAVLEFYGRAFLEALRGRSSCSGSSPKWIHKGAMESAKLALNDWLRGFYLFDDIIPEDEAS